jgi:hypothetical protein
MSLEDMDLTEGSSEEMRDHIFDCHEVIKSLRRQVYILLTDKQQEKAKKESIRA